jgi:hypothetical protein
MSIALREDAMKRMASVIQGATIFLLIFLFQESMAGVVIEEVHKDTEGKTSTVLRYFSENKFRTDHPDSGLSTVIDFGEDRIVMIDHSSKSFVEIKFSQWEKEVAKRLKEGFPAITPKARKIVVKKAGEKATINGFQTEKIEIWADGELIEEDWVTRDVEMRDVEKVMDKVAQGFSKQFRIEMKEGREIYEQLKSYGFPILVKDYALTYGLRPIDVLEIKRLEKRELKDGLFLPPSGYQRIIPKIPKK